MKHQMTMVTEECHYIIAIWLQVLVTANLTYLVLHTLASLALLIHTFAESCLDFLYYYHVIFLNAARTKLPHIMTSQLDIHRTWCLLYVYKEFLFCLRNTFDSLLFTCFDLFQGATILDRPVCITNWGQSEDEFNIWNRPTWKIEDESSENVCLFIFFFHLLLC